MKSLQKFGGFAALYMALAHLMGLIIFIVILDYISITDLAQKVAMNVDNQAVVFSTNLLMYVFFGFFLIVFSLALYNRLKAGSPALIQVATMIGIIWAGSLIASGMVANAALSSVVALNVTNPTQAALTWQGVEPVIDGLGNANGEILGGLMTLLISLAALRSGQLCYSGLHQHNRFSSEGRHECRQPGGRFFNQPAHVCFLWLFSDCIFTRFV